MWGAMRGLVRQLLALILTALLSVGPAWSVAHGSGMREITTAMDSDAGSCDGCHKCPMTGDEHTKAFLCGVTCGMATETVGPQIVPVALMQTRLAYVAREQSLRGRSLPPDPYPRNNPRAV
jgi:hypothetical protein